MTAILTKAAALNATDRCDRCNAPALIRAELTSGNELLFCNHHGTQHRAKLLEISSELFGSDGNVHHFDSPPIL